MAASGARTPIEKQLARLLAMKQAVILGGFGLVVVTLLIVWAYSRATNNVVNYTTNNQSGIQLNLQHPITSPVAYLPDFADSDSGKMRVTLDGFGAMPTIQKDVAYYRLKNNQVAFDMLPDDPAVNKALAYVVAKAGGTYVADASGASRFMSFDFKTLFNLHTLTETYPDMYSGLLDAYNNKTAVKGAAGQLKAAVTNQSCTAAADSLQKLISDDVLNVQRLTPTGAVQSTTPTGDTQLVFSIAPNYFKDIDAAVTDFITNCYSLSADQADRDYLTKLIAAYTTHPTYDFTITVTPSGKRRLAITSRYLQADAAQSTAGPSIIFEPLDEAAPDVTVSGPVRSMLARPNTYGLSYSYCRVPPLVVLEGESKHYIAALDSLSYPAPSSYDAVYACTAQDERLKDLSVLPQDIWRRNGRNVRVSDEASRQYVKLHDIAYAVEQYFLKTSTYPTIEAMQAGQITGLETATIQDDQKRLINSGDLRYSVSPDNCASCINYTLEYTTAKDGVVKLVDYSRQGDGL